VSPSEALLAFVLELTRAAKDLGLEPPAAQIITQPPADAHNAWAYTSWSNDSPTVPTVALTDLGVLTYITAWQRRETRSAADRWLRCIARHEVSHVYLEHYSGGLKAEVAVGVLMRDRWNEPTPQCNAR